jgi:DNA-binding transcriptional regulator YiaG
MDGRCISQNELAQRWQVSEATLERWRSQRMGPQFLRLGGQVRYRLVDVES